MLRRLFGRIGARDRESILRETREHIEVAVETNEELRAATGAFLEGRYDEVGERLEGATELERRADDIRRTITTRIAKGQVVPLESEEYMRLVDSMDVLADLGREGIELLHLQEQEVPGELQGPVESMQDEVFGIVDMAKMAAFRMRPDIEEAYELTWDIEEREEGIDRLYLETMGELFSLDLPTPQFFQLYEFVSLLEDLADSAEEVANQIKIISARYITEGVEY